MTKAQMLEPCPFCGSPAVKTRFEQHPGTAPGCSIWITQIQCGNDDDCKVCVDIQHINEAVAIEAWNTRLAAQADAPAALPQRMPDREQLAKIFAIIWHGDTGEWKGFLSKADDFLAFPFDTLSVLRHEQPQCVREAALETAKVANEVLAGHMYHWMDRAIKAEAALAHTRPDGGGPA